MAPRLSALTSTLLVVDVKDHASAALVTRSLSELGPGDRVEMRVAGQ